MSETNRKTMRKNLFVAGGVLAILFVVLGLLSSERGRKKETTPVVHRAPMPVDDPEHSPTEIKQAHMELEIEELKSSLEDLRRETIDLKEENTLLSGENEKLRKTTGNLKSSLERTNDAIKKVALSKEGKTQGEERSGFTMRVWQSESAHAPNNVEHTIPAGTVVRCLLVSTAYCPVGAGSASDPRQMILQPVANGQLPKRVRVLLKGARFLGTAVGDRRSERAYVRVERMTKMIGKGGDFISTSMAGFVVDADGAEGISGVLIDKAGQFILRSGVAAALQGIGQGLQAAINNQTISKLAREGSTRPLLNMDTFKNAGITGSSTSLQELAKYYLDQAKDLAPVLEISRKPTRTVDVVFVKDVGLGEKNIKKAIENERAERMQRRDVFE
ncbi:MAG: hypothetical protein OXF02_02715 [Simkaniaceae bacterium]|nr:hypothetical protein [Simkaniaceae bacterium]